jgi:transposase
LSGRKGPLHILDYFGTFQTPPWDATECNSVNNRSRQNCEESYNGAESVCDVARRHGLTPTQLFSWRRDARGKSVEGKQADAFVPAMIVADPAPIVAPAIPSAESAASRVIEIEVGNSHVWIWSDADIRLATAVIRALQAAT